MGNTTNRIGKDLKVKGNLVTTDSSPIKNCPFCNGEPDIYIETGTRGDPAMHYVYCSICQARGSYSFNEEEAINYWNLRYVRTSKSK